MNHEHDMHASGTGREWLVEAFGCDTERLTSIAALQRLFDVAVRELALHPVGAAVWHQFPTPGGITGMWLLAESHLTVHTFPEFGSVCINLFCCTPRRAWDWQSRLAALLGATEVRVRSMTRAYGAADMRALVADVSGTDTSGTDTSYVRYGHVRYGHLRGARVTAPAGQRHACPSCGASIVFLWAQAVQTTCDFCKSVLVRTGLDLEKVGQQADFPATASPVQIGMQGRWKQRTFTVVGRLTYEWARGRWNEWYLRLGDGNGAWLSDAQLEYALTTEIAPGKPLPDPMSLSVGDTVATDRHRFVVTNITLAEYVGTEGELPFATGGRALSTFVDLITQNGIFATLDGSETPPLLFMGDYVSWDDMAPQGAREFEGW